MCNYGNYTKNVAKKGINKGIDSDVYVVGFAYLKRKDRRVKQNTSDRSIKNLTKTR